MICFAVKSLFGYTVGMAPPAKETRDFLLRGFPVEVGEKLKVAASLHRTSLKAYIQGVLEVHLRDLERRGITLTLPKGKG